MQKISRTKEKFEKKLKKYEVVDIIFLLGGDDIEISAWGR